MSRFAARSTALVAVLLLGCSLVFGCGNGEEPGDNRQNDNYGPNVGENFNEREACDPVDCEGGERCYRGECLDECSDAGDCAEDQRCWAERGHCVSLDCVGYECAGGEFCYYGVCAANCNVDEDCQGPDAVCEEGHCIDLCFERDGQEVCPELSISTLEPTDIAEESATIGGELQEIPATLPTDHGVCWSEEPEPAIGDDDCRSEGMAFGARTFETEIDGLTEGTEYYVRAYAEVRGEFEYADEVSFEATDKGDDPGGDIHSLYTGSQDETACKINDSGTDSEWCYDGHDDWIDRIAVDPEGNLYTASHDGEACRIDDDGQAQHRWCHDHGYRVYDVAVGSDFAYTVGVDSQDDDGEVCKLTLADGDDQWCEDHHDALIRALAVDTDYVYTAGDDGEVCVLNDDGTEQQCFRAHVDGEPEVIHSIAVDGDYVYTASWDETACKFDIQGDEQWCWDGHDDEVRGVAVDADGYVYTASVDHTVCKLDDGGDEQWCNDDHDIWVESVAVDPSGFVYTGPQTGDDPCKLDSGGDRIWCYDGHGDQVQGVAVEPGLYGAFPGEW